MRIDTNLASVALVSFLSFQVVATTSTVSSHTICPALSTHEKCPNIAKEGLACEDCLRASGEDLTLTPETDPVWRPNPEAIPQPQQHSKLSSLCIWAIRYYLYSISPKPSQFRRTMFRMCSAIEEFGPTVIGCVGGEHPVLAYHIVGQIVRCEFARKKLGDGWGTEKAEKTRFFDIDTNRSLDATEFIRDGFMRLKKESRLQLNLNA